MVLGKVRAPLTKKPKISVLILYASPLHVLGTFTLQTVSPNEVGESTKCYTGRLSTRSPTPWPFVHHLGKDTPFEWNIPVYSIIRSAPPPRYFLNSQLIYVRLCSFFSHSVPRCSCHDLCRFRILDDLLEEVWLRCGRLQLFHRCSYNSVGYHRDGMSQPDLRGGTRAYRAQHTNVSRDYSLSPPLFMKK